MEEENKEQLPEAEPVTETATPPAKKLNPFDKFFGITASGSTFKAEIIAGLTTFMAMVYILMVNAGIFTSLTPVLDAAGKPVLDATGEAVMAPIIPGLSYGAMYIATAIGAIAGTLLMALLARMPLAQASGMGVNAFIVFSLVQGAGLTYANAMVFTLLDGVIFIILTVTGLRKKIFEAIPAGVRHAIPVGVGLFIAFIGMQNAGIIVNSDSTLVTFTSFNVLAQGFSYGAVVGPVLAIAILAKKNVKGSILWGILGTAVAYYALMGLGCAWNDAVCVKLFQGISIQNPFDAFKDWGTQSVGQVFVQGFNFAGYEGGTGALILLIVTTALSLCMIDMFDTIGTLIGVASKADMLDQDGKLPRIKGALMADAVATTAGAVLGTTTTTTFVESASGVTEGGKTGLTSVTTAVLFGLALFLSPIFLAIPSFATAPALIVVGFYMLTNVVNINFSDISEALPCYICIAAMPFFYSISEGISMGVISYVALNLLTGRTKEKKISILMYVLAVLFILKYIFL